MCRVVFTAQLARLLVRTRIRARTVLAGIIKTATAKGPASNVQWELTPRKKARRRSRLAFRCADSEHTRRPALCRAWSVHATRSLLNRQPGDSKTAKPAHPTHTLSNLQLRASISAARSARQELIRRLDSLHARLARIISSRICPACRPATNVRRT